MEPSFTSTVTSKRQLKPPATVPHPTQFDCDMLAYRLNTRPRTRFGYRTAHEMFDDSSYPLHLWCKSTLIIDRDCELRRDGDLMDWGKLLSDIRCVIPNIATCLSREIFVPFGMKMKQPANRGRGRPLAFDPERALDAAMHVFWLKGYEGASMSDLTEAMGINKPSLYGRFNDKRGLFLAAIERYNETVGASNLQKVLDGTTVGETISGYLAAVNAFLTSPDTPPGCMIGSVATDMAGRDDEIRVQIAELFESTEEFLTQRFTELGDAPIDERTLAEIIVSFGQSLAARARVGATLTDLNARTDRFLSVVLGTDEPPPPD